MNNNLIVKLSNINVYYVKEAEIEYYISIPFNNINMDVQISMEMMDSRKINPNENDPVWIKDTITNIYKEIDLYSLCYVLPIFNNNQITMLNSNNEEAIKIFDKGISSIINSSYKMLVNNNLKVDRNIALIDTNINKNLIDWFTNKYAARVILKTRISFLEKPASEELNYQKIDTPGMSFVVGQAPVEPTPVASVSEPAVVEPTTPVQNSQIEVQAPKEDGQVIENKKAIPKMEHDYGYVSYYALGLVTIILTLLVLYILI